MPTHIYIFTSHRVIFHFIQENQQILFDTAIFLSQCNPTTKGATFSTSVYQSGVRTVTVRTCTSLVQRLVGCWSFPKPYLYTGCTLCITDVLMNCRIGTLPILKRPVSQSATRQSTFKSFQHSNDSQSVSKAYMSQISLDINRCFKFCINEMNYLPCTIDSFGPLCQFNR